ncbi:MAG: hypothetical protein QOI98_1781 [Solirubrobacteraceae bacterium]|jgi:hypothetical protein|nr:hypothetical protein [Solirubrobacteraceae bacterium]
MRARSLKFALTVAAVLAFVVPTTAAARTVPVEGRWQQLVNCAITSYNPFTKEFSCIGSSLWTGALTGVTDYVATGTFHALSGDAAGTIRETFRGRDDLGHRGTIAFTETFTLDGGASLIHIDATALGGTRGFAGVRGRLQFDGFDNVATGFGPYTGFLRLRR